MARKAETATETVDNETGEIVQENATEGQLVAVDDGFGTFAGELAVSVKRRVAVAGFQFKDNMRILTRFLSPIVEGKEINEGKRGPKMGKAYVTTIQSVTGEVRSLVVGTVLMAELLENYPDNAYVGAWFDITKHAPKNADTRYATYSITEIHKPRGAVDVPLDSVTQNAVAGE